MKRLLVFFLLINVACIDDRDLSVDDVVLNPEYRLNFVNFEFTANTREICPSLTRSLILLKWTFLGKISMWIIWRPYHLK